MLSRLLVEVQAAVVEWFTKASILPLSSAAIDQQPTHNSISVAELGGLWVGEGGGGHIIFG